METCIVCKEPIRSRMSKVCSFACGDIAINDKKTYPKFDLHGWDAGECEICKRKIYANNRRKFCGPKCYRQSLKIRGVSGREAIPESMRLDVLQRDRNKCVYCQGSSDCLDHVYPVCKGGDTTMENLVAACSKCNSAAAGNSFENVEEKRKHILKKRNIVIPDYEKDELDDFARPSWHSVFKSRK